MSLYKYGVDPNAVPADDNQIREIKKLAADIGLTLDDVDRFETYDEANKVIDRLKRL